MLPLLSASSGIQHPHSSPGCLPNTFHDPTSMPLRHMQPFPQLYSSTSNILISFLTTLTVPIGPILWLRGFTSHWFEPTVQHLFKLIFSHITVSTTFASQFLLGICIPFSYSSLFFLFARASLLIRSKTSQFSKYFAILTLHKTTQSYALLY